MLIGITKEKEIKSYRARLKNELQKITTENIRIRYSSKKGVGELVEASYSEKYDMWWFFGSKIDQYWNPFGMGKPIDEKATTGRCQINMTKKGLNKSVGGAFGVDAFGEIYLLHNGRIGGGTTGISREPFLEYYPVPLFDVNFDGKIAQYFIVAQLGAKKFYDQINYFVEQVYAFKESVKIGNTKKISRFKRTNILTNGESEFRNPYNLPPRNVLPGADHAIITSALLNKLKENGLKAFRNRFIDCFILDDDGKYTHIFEVKSNLTTKSLYTAIGQLMIYGLKINAKYYLVIEGPITKKLISDLKVLHIHIITFFWKNGVPKFRDLEL